MKFGNKVNNKFAWDAFGEEIEKNDLEKINGGNKLSLMMPENNMCDIMMPGTQNSYSNLNSNIEYEHKFADEQGLSIFETNSFFRRKR